MDKSVIFIKVLIHSTGIEHVLSLDLSARDPAVNTEEDPGLISLTFSLCSGDGKMSVVVLGGYFLVPRLKILGLRECTSW